MGDTAEMMLDGTLCQHCGAYEDHDDLGGDIPYCCSDCRRNKRARAECALCEFWHSTRAAEGAK